MKKRKPPTPKPTPDLIPRPVLESAITISTRQLLESGAAVLGSHFGFTDEQQARWIELTADAAKARVLNLSELVGRVNEKMRDET